uniref:Uncharacterized protein n=1 Tax=Sphaeramia orbicularis TaxID=375764 RepID=A0A673AEK2_9TELE
MKTEPTGIGAGLMDLIPRSCQFPANINHVTQVFNMKNLRKADLISVSVATTRLASNRKTRPQGVLQTASGSRTSGPPPQNGRKTSAAPDGIDSSVLCVSNLFWPGSSSDLQVWSSWESNEGAEPQLSLEEEVFTFSSQPHSPKRGQGQGDQEKTETGDHRVQNKSGRRCDAQPEDDFIGSESDEVCFDSILDVELDYEVHPESQNINQTSSEDSGHGSTDVLTLSTSTGRAETSEMVPRHCLSPSASLVCLHLDCFRRTNHYLFLIITKEEDKKLPVDSSDCMSSLLGNLHLCQDDDEELRMLASLKREQEEDECRASGLSASQIHRCNVSISMSSDDTSTWTHVSMVCGIFFCSSSSFSVDSLLTRNIYLQPILHSLFVPLSFFFLFPTGEDEPVTEEDEYLNLLYDPCLNCYFDPKTGKYYELA